MPSTRTKAPAQHATRKREDELRAQGFRTIAGVDEVGVGPMAGPVVAAAVILPPGLVIEGVRDSKLVDEPEREKLELQILAHCLASGIGQVSVAEIDRIGIYEASALAMCRAVQALAVAPDYLMIDARSLALSIPQEGPVRGDREHTCIAAASIVAKQFRDRLMIRLHDAHPDYGFDVHKGYPTPRHLAALAKHGASAVHRVSWLAVREAAGLLPPAYYKLHAEVQAADGPDALGQIQNELRIQRDNLDPEQHDRLKALLRRRAQALQAPRLHRGRPKSTPRPGTDNGRAQPSN